MLGTNYLQKLLLITSWDKNTVQKFNLKQFNYVPVLYIWFFLLWTQNIISYHFVLFNSVLVLQKILR